ncbi:MAG: hypothetical protein GY772_16720, partial [bacterium]|nr:hypothetical protein [bacterium]
MEQIRELLTEASSLVATVRTLGDGAKKWSLQDIAESASTLRTAVSELQGKAAEVGKWVTILRERATAREKLRRASMRPAAQALNKALRGFSEGLPWNWRHQFHRIGFLQASPEMVPPAELRPWTPGDTSELSFAEPILFKPGTALSHRLAQHSLSCSSSALFLVFSPPL